MTFAYIVVILVGIAALVGTVMVAGKSDENYHSSTKGNLTRILLLYILLGIIFIIGAIALIVYLF